MRKYLCCDFAEWKKYSLIQRTFHLLLWLSFPSSLQNVFTVTNSEDRPTIDGKNSAKCRANLLAEHWTRCTPSTTWGYKFQSLLVSVGELSGDKVLLSSPSIQAYLWNLLKSSSCNQGSFSRERKDPGNKVGHSCFVMWNQHLWGHLLPGNLNANYL